MKFDSDIYSKETWSVYHASLQMLRSSLMEADEGSMYTKDDADLTHEGILELIDFLDKNKNLKALK